MVSTIKKKTNKMVGLFPPGSSLFVVVSFIFQWSKNVCPSRFSNSLNIPHVRPAISLQKFTDICEYLIDAMIVITYNEVMIVTLSDILNLKSCSSSWRCIGEINGIEQIIHNVYFSREVHVRLRFRRVYDTVTA